MPAWRLWYDKAFIRPLLKWNDERRQLGPAISLDEAEFYAAKDRDAVALIDALEELRLLYDPRESIAQSRDNWGRLIPNRFVMRRGEWYAHFIAFDQLELLAGQLIHFGPISDEELQSQIDQAIAEGALKDIR